MQLEGSAQSSPLQVDRCQYPNKQCPNPRTFKTNGQPHRFCQLHRHQANEHQRRWLHRRSDYDGTRVSRKKPSARREASMLKQPDQPRAAADQQLVELESVLTWVDEIDLAEFSSDTDEEAKVPTSFAV